MTVDSELAGGLALAPVLMRGGSGVTGAPDGWLPVPDPIIIVLVVSYK